MLSAKQYSTENHQLEPLVDSITVYMPAILHECLLSFATAASNRRTELVIELRHGIPRGVGSIGPMQTV